MSDDIRQMLNDVLRASRGDDNEEMRFPPSVFRTMLARLDAGRPLSDNQIAWIRGVYERLGDGHKVEK